MPKSKKEGLLLSFIMSFLMIYVMAALNHDVQVGAFVGESWVIALERLPLGFLFGILCDFCICTPLSRRIVAAVAHHEDRELYLVLILRFCMVVFMTVFMTLFGVVAGGARGVEIVKDFFVYFPYNFTIALPIQMAIVAPMASRLARRIATKTEAREVA